VRGDLDGRHDAGVDRAHLDRFSVRARRDEGKMGMIGRQPDRITIVAQPGESRQRPIVCPCGIGRYMAISWIPDLHGQIRPIPTQIRGIACREWTPRRIGEIRQVDRRCGGAIVPAVGEQTAGAGAGEAGRDIDEIGEVASRRRQRDEPAGDPEQCHDQLGIVW